MLKLGPRRRDRSNAGTTGSPRAAGLLRTRPASRGPHAPHLVRAAGADDMVEVGKRLKAGDAVVLDLETLPDHLKRRLLDACAGLALWLRRFDDTHGIGSVPARAAAAAYQGRRAS